ncbi:MAG: hypothetical protein JSR40_18400 [Proteobacteria bacterium]|nr:hypothetical protein [Pseudomonadota bacterium]
MMLSISGCAIQQKVKPVDPLADNQICIVERRDVKAGFLDTYKRALSAKGYAVTQLAPSASLRACPVTSTYTANWRWDLALYMAYAEIRVFNDGKPAGEAIYDAKGGGASFGKFIDAETKITELVDQLFPGEAPR